MATAATPASAAATTTSGRTVETRRGLAAQRARSPCLPGHDEDQRGEIRPNQDRDERREGGSHQRSGGRPGCQGKCERATRRAPERPTSAGAPGTGTAASVARLVTTSAAPGYPVRGTAISHAATRPTIAASHGRHAHGSELAAEPQGDGLEPGQARAGRSARWRRRRQPGASRGHSAPTGRRCRGWRAAAARATARRASAAPARGSRPSRLRRR